MTIEAKIVAHSSHPGCPDLITVQARYPRFIHSEVMTHRAFSRSASSSRAVPVARMIQDVLDDPAMPVEWGSNKAGMQAGDEVKGQEDAKYIWRLAMQQAVTNAKELSRIGLHKQIVNRILEPFGHISVVITSTDWNNFFNLRCHPAADPTMRALAEAIRDVIGKSTSQSLDAGQWHLPYGGNLSESAARCARVSYLRHDGAAPSNADDMSLAVRLREEKHMSPFEHQATPTPGQRNANFSGWKSQRVLLEIS
jgi:hypothetical protein